MKAIYFSFLLLSICPLLAPAQEKLTDDEILKLYDGLRVADVSDGMDMVGLRDAGLMDQRIEALWKDTEKFETSAGRYCCYRPLHSHQQGY
jgi:hypothetical protein